MQTDISQSKLADCVVCVLHTAHTEQGLEVLLPNQLSVLQLFMNNNTLYARRLYEREHSKPIAQVPRFICILIFRNASHDYNRTKTIVGIQPLWTNQWFWAASRSQMCYGKTKTGLKRYGTTSRDVKYGACDLNRDKQARCRSTPYQTVPSHSNKLIIENGG